MYLTEAPGADDCSLWEVTVTTGGWLVRNVGAAYNGNHNQYLEYYYGFTTYGLASNLSRYTYSFYKFNGFTPAAPSSNLEQDAPTGLTGVAPTTASNNDGKITGTTTAMEYKLSSASAWTACQSTSIMGLLPGSYDVRYASKTGYNASPSITIVVSTYGSSTYAIKDLTLQPGASQSAMNFCWYSSGTSTVAQVQIAPKSAMTAQTSPASSAATYSGMAVASGAFRSNEVAVTGLAATTQYVYRVGNGTDFSAVYNFTTRDTTAYSACSSATRRSAPAAVM